MFGLYSILDGYFFEVSLPTVKRAKLTRELYTNQDKIAVISYDGNFRFNREYANIKKPADRKAVQKALNKLKGVSK